VHGDTALLAWRSRIATPILASNEQRSARYTMKDLDMRVPSGSLGFVQYMPARPAIQFRHLDAAEITANIHTICGLHVTL